MSYIVLLVRGLFLTKASTDMGPRVTLAFVALLCGLFPPIHGSKVTKPSVNKAKHVNAPHAGAPHPAGAPDPGAAPHPAGAPHPAAAPHPAGAPHPLSHPAGAPHMAGKPHPVLHRLGKPHTASHPATAPNPLVNALKHSVHHPLKHLDSYFLKNRGILLPYTIHHPNKTHHHRNTTSPLKYEIPDILDIASEAFSYSDSLLKRYVRDGNVEGSTLEIALNHTEAVKKILERAIFDGSDVYPFYQRAMGFLLKQLIADINATLAANKEDGFGGMETYLLEPATKAPKLLHRPGKTTRPKALPHTVASPKAALKPVPAKVFRPKAALKPVPAKVFRPKAALKPVPLTPENYIPVKWEAISHPHSASHP